MRRTASLRTRLGLGAVAGALLMGISLALSFYALSRLESFERAEGVVRDARLMEQRLVRSLNEVLLSGGSTAPRQQATDLTPVLESIMRRSAENDDLPEVKAAFNGRVLPLWGEIRPLVQALLARRTLSPEEVEDQIALGKIIALSDKLSGELEAAVALANRSLDAERQRIHLALGGGGIVIAAFMVLLMGFVYRSVLRALGDSPERMAEVLEGLARGDLATTVVAREGDTTSAMTALVRTRESLAAAVTEIRAAAENVGRSAQEIAEGNSALSGRTEEQASALEEAAAAMEQMTTTIAQNAQNAAKASTLAVGASDIAKRGGEAVRSVVGTMEGITASSRKIADITGVIDDIAFQTNILALNAAVEAARAGEQGRGFAVVAGEVRSLAQRSAEAAREIKGLIAESVTRVDAGSAQVEAAGRTVDEIMVSANAVSELVHEIAAASREQAQGIEQVSESVAQLEKMTQQNAAMVEEANAAAASLGEQAALLGRAVGSFDLGEDRIAVAPTRRRTSRSAAMPVPKLRHRSSVE